MSAQPVAAKAVALFLLSYPRDHSFYIACFLHESVLMELDLSSHSLPSVSLGLDLERLPAGFKVSVLHRLLFDTLNALLTLNLQG